MWFLAGTSGDFTAQRERVIPLDRHILVPVIDMRDSNRRKDDRSYLPGPCEVLQKSAAVHNELLGSVIVLIDGVPVTDVARFRVRSKSCFPLLADDPDSELMAADGYSLLLKPLPPGRHTLIVGAYAAGRSNGYGRMVQNFESCCTSAGRRTWRRRSRWTQPWRWLRCSRTTFPLGEGCRRTRVPAGRLTRHHGSRAARASALA